MDLPRKKSLRKNVKDISKNADESNEETVVKETASNSVEIKSNSLSKSKDKRGLTKRKASLDSQNSGPLSPTPNNQFGKSNFMVTVYRDNIDTVHSSSTLKVSDSNSTVLYNSHRPVVTLEKVSLNQSTNEYKIMKTPNQKRKSVSFNEQLSLSNLQTPKSKEAVNKVRRSLEGNSIPSSTRGENMLRRSLSTPAKVSVMNNSNKKENNTVKPIQSNVVNSLNVGTTVADVEVTSETLSSLKLSSAKKSNISSAKSKSKIKKGVRFGDQVGKESESDVCLLSDTPTTQDKDVVSLTSSDDQGKRGDTTPISLNGPSTPETAGSKSPRKKANKKKEKTPTKKVQKEVDFSSSDDETIASFISRESTPKKDTQIIEESKFKKNEKGRKRKLSDKESTPNQGEHIGNRTPRKVRKQMSPRKINKDTASPKRVLAEQKDQGESQENEVMSPKESASKKPKRAKKATGKENKSTKETKKTQKLLETEESGVSEANDTQTSCKTDEHFSEHGDMPLITCSISPVAPKQSKNKIKKELETLDVVKAPSQRGRKRAIDEDGAPKKKRGRKRIKKEAVFLEASQRAENTEDEDLEDDELGGPNLINKRKIRKKTERRTGRRFSVTGNWYIASGYLNDIISLLEEFDNIKSWRFKDFSICWRSKMFSLVYRGRQTFKELLEFSEEIALLTKRFLSPPHSIKRRVGALYTLYGLYYKFPLGKRQFFNLRFELREYEELLSLIFPFRSNVDNPDPAYIFRKLELDGAILHCATAFEPCYDFHNEERDNVELEYGKERLAKSSAVSNAIPLVQLKADLDLLQHYHSIKAKVAGEEDPEKALRMITPEFLEGIFTNLSHLKRNTLEELGMTEDRMNLALKAGDETEKTETKEDLCLRLDSTNSIGELELYSIEPKAIVDRVNNCPNGQRSQKAIENNQLVADEDVRDFMRPPTAEDLQRPLLFNKKKRGRKSKKGPNYSMEWNNRNVKKESVDGEEWDGKVLLDVNEEPRDVYQELTEVLLPQPLPQKKKRKPKRPPALLREASFPSKRTPKKNTTISINKRLMDETEENEDEKIDGKNNIVLEPMSATRLLVSDLPDMKQNVAATIIKVRMRTDDIRKIVKLKVKVSPDQFNEIRKSPSRYKNFQTKLMPLIKMTQKNDNKDKDWQIEEIFLYKEENSIENAKENNTSIPEVDVEQSPKKVVPFKLKYECLRHSDDEEADEVVYEDDEDLFPCKWKTEEDKDGDYSPPPDVEEEEEDPLEYQDEGIDDEYEDFIPEPQYFWRRRGRRNYYGNYFEERGPRDSDNLLKPRTEKNSVAMIPMRVGGAVKYFPMIKTNETRPPPTDIIEGPEKTNEVEEEVLPVDPKDTNAIFTWNDFSSDKSPPFKKKRGSKSYSYIFSPKLPIKRENNQAPLRKVVSTTAIKPLVKKSVEESNQVENVTEESPPKTPEKARMNLRKKVQDEENDELIVTVKKEMSVLEELAGDWDDEDSISGTRRGTPMREKQQEEDPLEVPNKNIKDSPSKGSENSLVSSQNVVFVGDDVYPICSDVDIVDATYIQTEEEDLGVQDDENYEDYEDNYSQNESTAKNDFNGSYIEGIDDIQDIAILPHIPVPSTSYEKEGKGEKDFPLPVTMTTTTVVPGDLIMCDPISVEQEVSSSYASQVMDMNDKPPLYYKVTTADGSNAFIPISSLSEIPPKNIEVLSFEVADVKPYLPNIDSTENSFVESVFENSVSQSTDNHLYPFSSTVQENDNILAGIPTENILNQSSYSDSNGVNPSQPSYPSFNMDTASYDFNETKPSCSFFKSNKNNTPKTSSKPISDVANTPLNNASQPACAFFFSSRLKGTLGNLSSAKGIASGRSPVVETPKVKFLMKGFFGSKKRK